MGWKKCQVRSGFNPMGERFIKCFMKGKSSRVPFAGDHQFAFVSAAPFTKDDQPDIIGQQPVDDRQENIDPFLLREA